MAVIKYKDNEGNFHKVSIGGGSGTDEVYIGSDEPPVGTKVWIDPTGTPSQPSAGVEVIDNLESDSTTAALSARQGRVLKEMIEQGGASGGNKDLTVYIDLLQSAELSSEMKEVNSQSATSVVEMISRFECPKVQVQILYDGMFVAFAYPLHLQSAGDAMALLLVEGLISGELNCSYWKVTTDGDISRL